MRHTILVLVFGVLLLAAAAVVMFLRVPEFRDWIVDQPNQQDRPAVSAPAPAEPSTAPWLAPEEPPSVPEAETVPGPEAAPSERSVQDGRQVVLDPIADFARYIAERHREWRVNGGEFLAARELAALYGLDVYALPEGRRPPPPGVTSVGLKLGYFVAAPRFVESLVAEGRRLRPLQERDIGDGSGDAGVADPPTAYGAWTRDLLEQTAQKARQLAACDDASNSEEECRFTRAFMRGLTGSEADAERLQSSAADALLDMASRLEAKAAQSGRSGAQAAP